jgi:hypothetical protein
MLQSGIVWISREALSRGVVGLEEFALALVSFGFCEPIRRAARMYRNSGVGSHPHPHRLMPRVLYPVARSEYSVQWGSLGPGPGRVVSTGQGAGIPWWFPDSPQIAASAPCSGRQLSLFAKIISLLAKLGNFRRKSLICRVSSLLLSAPAGPVCRYRCIGGGRRRLSARMALCVEPTHHDPIERVRPLDIREVAGIGDFLVMAAPNETREMAVLTRRHAGSSAPLTTKVGRRDAG